MWVWVRDWGPAERWARVRIGVDGKGRACSVGSTRFNGSCQAASCDRSCAAPCTPYPAAASCDRSCALRGPIEAASPAGVLAAALSQPGNGLGPQLVGGLDLP